MNRYVLPTGPSPCDFMFVSESPGETDEALGFVSQGRPGELLNQMIRDYLMPLGRDDVYVSNIVKHRCTKINKQTGKVESRPPTQEEIECYRDDVLAEIAAVQPKVIVTLGVQAAQWFLGPDAHMDVVHGRAHSWDNINACALDVHPTIFCIYHPAVALWSPDMKSFLHYDFQQFRAGVKHGFTFAPEDQWPEPNYIDIQDSQFAGEWSDSGYAIEPGAVMASWLYQTLKDQPYLAIDTEGDRHFPWGLQFCVEPGTAYVLRRGVADRALAAFGRALATYRGTVVLHSVLHDFEVMAALGIDLAAMVMDQDTKVIDTMILAYLLGLEPQGLKPLARRWAGMVMMSYDEVVADANERLAERYLWRIKELAPATLMREQSRARCGKRCGRTSVGTCVLPKHKWLDTRFAKAVHRCLAKEGGEVRRLWEQQEDDLHDTAFGVAGFDLPDATLDQVPLERAVRYAARDADATRRIVEPLLALVHANGQGEICRIDHLPLAMISDMQQTGQGIDHDWFASLNRYLATLIVEKDEEIEREAGHPLNVNSSDQVAEELFEVRRLRPTTGRFKRTKGGKISTQDKFLQAIKDQDPLVDMIIDGRELRKLRSTYALRIPAFALAEPDRRLHPHIRVTRVETGRLSATAPNVLAIPKHSDLGKLIRAGFVARPGCLLGSWDLDQIEMRVMAHTSQDPDFCRVFREGKIDIHSYNAHTLLGAPARREDQDESLHRLPAKALGFGMLMGITAHGLLGQLHKAAQFQWTLESAQQLLDDFYARYTGIRDFVRERHRFTRAHGYSETFSGRRKYLANIWSEDEMERAAAEREAQSFPIQGGAQEVVKPWMAAAYRQLRILRSSSGLYVHAWLQVHDDVIVEFDVSLKDDVDRIMTSCIPQILSVPIKAKGKFGETWCDICL